MGLGGPNKSTQEHYCRVEDISSCSNTLVRWEILIGSDSICGKYLDTPNVITSIILYSFFVLITKYIFMHDTTVPTCC